MNRKHFSISIIHKDKTKKMHLEVSYSFLRDMKPEAVINGSLCFVKLS